jgi:hypothetical protein
VGYTKDVMMTKVYLPLALAWFVDEKMKSSEFPDVDALVLDGQQRLTSLFRVLFHSRIKDRTTPNPDLLVALSPAEECVNDPFHLRSLSIHRKTRDGLLCPI